MPAKVKSNLVLTLTCDRCGKEQVVRRSSTRSVKNSRHTRIALPNPKGWVFGHGRTDGLSFCSKSCSASATAVAKKIEKEEKAAISAAIMEAKHKFRSRLKKKKKRSKA